MSVEIYETQTYSGLTPSVAPARMRELVELLVSVTPASVYRLDSDTDTLYDVLVFIGGDRYARFSAGSDESLKLAIGYMNGDTFVETDSSMGVIPTHYTISYNNTVTVVNDGAVWELTWIGSHGTTVKEHIRAFKLVSSITGQAVWCLGQYTTAGPNSPPRPFPDDTSDHADRVLIDSTAHVIKSSNPTTAVNNVPAGKQLLFPTLLCTDARILLGVPTIGKQRTYFMSGQATVPLNAYTEFKVGIQKFVSLGYVAIRSE